ncbi:PCRF domain-containing protein [Candidatus Pacebacteria bacterium]|nr:PCRF domain-containing protein [Candidatus Paceibacterota bacterium]
MTDKSEIKDKITNIETEMNSPDFWNDKDLAQSKIKKLQELKDELEGFGKFDKGGAHLTIFSGAGGDDAEDFSRMLLEMYQKYISSKGWKLFLLHENKNSVGGYRNVTIEVVGKNAYKFLKHESGVHRLVRISPFNSAKQRHTSFSMVEVVPKLEKLSDSDLEIPEEELEIEFTKSSGPGGQNVNKRETAVRVVHLPTKLSAFIDTERSQLQNKEKALELIHGKVYNLREQERLEKEQGMQISKTTDAKWGSQIRSYVLHPYQMVKDHRTDFEVRDVEKVLGGDLDELIKKMEELQ